MDANDDARSDTSFEVLDPSGPEEVNEAPLTDRFNITRGLSLGVSRRSSWNSGSSSSIFGMRNGPVRESSSCQLPSRNYPRGWVLLGNGTVFRTYKGRFTNASGGKTEVAVKLPLSHSTTDHARAAVQHEIQVYKKIGNEHPNIVKCFGARCGDEIWSYDSAERVSLRGEEIQVVLEFLPTSLEKRLHEEGWFWRNSYKKLVEIFLDIAMGLCHMHEQGVVHCNLKPSGVLIDDKGRVKLADFRPLRLMRDAAIKKSQAAGNACRYRAPDLAGKAYFFGGEYARPAGDVFSFGAIMSECLTRGSGTRTGPVELLDLIDRCINCRVDARSSPAARPTAGEVLSSLTQILRAPWIDDQICRMEQVSACPFQTTSLKSDTCLIMQEDSSSGGVHNEWYQGWYKESCGSVHNVSIKLGDDVRHGNAREAIRNELRVFDKLVNGATNVVRCFGGNIGDAQWDMQHMNQISMDGAKNFVVQEHLPKDLVQLLYHDPQFARTCNYGRLVRIFLDIARGIRHMHRQGVVHCDLKPSNVLIGREGGAKLAGFTVSKIMKGGRLGQGLACASEYMAPELIYPKEKNGRRVEPTESIDVFSFGMIMAECLMRKQPFRTGNRRGREELWLLIDECCAHDTVDVENHVLRPSPDDIVNRLKDMRNEEWIHGVLPWVEEVRNRDELIAQSYAGRRHICSCVDPLEEDASGSMMRGLYLDSNGKVSDVMVKLPAQRKDKRALKATANELAVFEILARDRHENVVHCVGGNLGDGRWKERLERIEMDKQGPFSVMEPAPTNLRKLLYEDKDFMRRCTYRKMINLFIDMAEGLAHLHHNGVVHFGLKPGNVLVSCDGRAKIAGFHSSTVRQGQRTVPWQLGGTFGYMAPELFFRKPNGRELRISDSIDVFSLGVVMLECLTLQHPHDTQLRNCPELWAALNRCCNEYVQECGKDRSVVPTDDSGLATDLEEVLFDKWIQNGWIDAFTPFPDEFVSSIDTDSSPCGRVNSNQGPARRSSQVVNCLEKIAERKGSAEKLRWPADLCLIIARCLDSRVKDGHDYVTRPTPADVAAYLKARLNKPWLENFLPWVDDECKVEAVSGQLDYGWCRICDSDKRLGVGAFGTVFKGLYKDAAGVVHKVAIKLTNKLGEDEAIAALRNELETFDAMGQEHPNIVRCFGGSVKNSGLELRQIAKIEMEKEVNFVALELLPQNLHRLLYKDEDFAMTCTYRRAIGIFIGIAEGMLHLEKLNIVHFDLKPENVLIDLQGRPKVADFGNSKIRFQFSITSTPRGSLGYIAPELVAMPNVGQTNKASNSVDVFAFGVIMAECLTRSNPQDLSFGEEPKELWNLIGECCNAKVMDKGNHYVRPGRVELVKRLRAMLERNWADEFLPWVSERRYRLACVPHVCSPNHPA